MNTGQVTIDDVKYDVEVRNGIRYIDGKTVDDFLKTQSFDTLARLAKIGQKFTVAQKFNKPLAQGELQDELSSLEFLENTNDN